MKIYRTCKQHPLLSILLVSLLIRIAYLFLNYPLWWDSHVYIGAGKYLLSNGSVGLWETFRPIVHPLVLGSLWNIGFDPVATGKALDVILSLVILYLVYRITEKVWDERVAVVTTSIVSITPIFLQPVGLILSDFLAMTFGLIGLYLIIDKKDTTQLFFSGIALGFAFLTRFPVGIWFGAPFVVFVFRWIGLKRLFSYAIGFLAPVTPYLVSNHVLYGNALQPLLSGSWIVTTATWLYGSGLTYYLFHFFLGIPIFLFAFVYLYHFFKEKEWNDMNKTMLVSIGVLTILYFLTVPRKEVRYMLAAVPFLSMMVGASLMQIYHKLQQQKSPIVWPKSFVVIASVLLLIALPTIFSVEREPTFQMQIETALIDHAITKPVLASNPSHVSFLDVPSLTLLSGIEYGKIIYEQHKDEYGLLVVSSCDFHCAPGDGECEGRKKALFEMFEENQNIYRESFLLRKKQCEFTLYVPK